MPFTAFNINQFDDKYRDVYNKMQTSYASGVTINQSFWGEADK
ncbi:hypothetical protein UFOVP9_48 [uncultured Caudovirales phage]|jgi:hypothetical protein|uniref:Uncharacterized protein n=1 Tax=uncultured Caudovirales phage TaxID=2100421 RepID=A0A6J5KM26_9CAUD|nr:hypothetical protein UFOVP9_48 [uncultured Caudovirales phage]